MPKHFFADHEPNTSGRDFAVGDLHGCRAMLDTLLAHAAFDRQKDRLFSVGDLVDRGPDSMGCLALIGEPWFFPVLGNHDAMLLAWLMDQQGLNPGWLRYYVEPYLNPRNGGSWAQTVPHGARRNLIAELRTLPLARRAGRGGEQEFWVAHAEVFDQVSGEGLQERLHMDTPDIPDRKHYIGGSGARVAGETTCSGAAACTAPPGIIMRWVVGQCRQNITPVSRPHMWGTPSCPPYPARKETASCGCKATSSWMAARSMAARRETRGMD